MTQRVIHSFSALLLLLVVGWPTVATAQNTAFGFEFREVAKVVQAGDTLRSPWAGGLDSPQFSSLDLNGDSQNDLFIFDRRTRRVLTYLNAAAPGGGRQWQYAPDYALLFPTDLQNWALLRDYDCDGRPDLFTSANNGTDIRVYRNVAGAGGRPQFQLAVAQIRAVLTGSSPININTGNNLPSIKDVDGDGRLDILVVDWDSNRIITQYQNISTGACGGLSFQLTNEVWGNIRNCLGTCGSYLFSATPVICRPGQVQHTFGSNLTLIDLDGDGDQDALMGRDYCTELVSMLNQGTPQLAAMTSANANFPTAATAVRIPYFPAAYHLDVNFDGRPDLLVAPNVYDNLDSIEIRRTVSYYANTSTGTAPVFDFRQPDFLQKDMIETSTQAAPVFLDVDADGRQDLLVSGLRRDAPGGFLVASLAYYRNTGTATRPVYQLVTSDYLNLSAQKFGGLRPTITDLNRDGAPDLVCIGYYSIGRRQFLGYYQNLAAAGQAPNFDTANMRYIENVPNDADDAVTFFDVDNDGYVDMLYGTYSNRSDFPPGQGLWYFRNNGTSPVERAFVLTNSDFGQIRTAAGTRPAKLYPVVADFDGDTMPDLVTIDATGTVKFFANLRAQSGIFLERTGLFYNAATGAYDDGYLGNRESNHFALAAADVNGDGAPELFIGTEAGGVLAATTRNRVLSTRGAAARALPLSLYPNPATATATVEAARPVSLTLLDLTGRVVRTAATPARQHQLDLRGLAAGLYLVRCQTADGQIGMQRLVVK